MYTCLPIRVDVFIFILMCMQGRVPRFSDRCTDTRPGMTFAADAEVPPMGPEVERTALADLLAYYRQDDSSSDSSASTVPDMDEATIVMFLFAIYENKEHDKRNTYALTNSLQFGYIYVSAPPDGR